MDTLTPAEVTAVMLSMGQKKAATPYYIMFFKAWGAGFMVVQGAMVYQLIQGGSGTLHTNYPSIITLVAAFFFPVGLIMLVLTGMELCTANFMIFPMTTLKRRTKIWELPLNWLIVFFGNLSGALCFVAFLAHYSRLYSTDALVNYSKTVAEAKIHYGFGPTLLRGIGCNFLVCVAVWLGAGARETVSKIVALHFPIFTFVFLGFEHVIVNMYYLPIGMINGANVSVGQYIGHSMVPSFIGNVIGGCLLGIPMVLYYDAPELPFFNRHSNRRNEDSPSTSDDVDTGGGTLGGNIKGVNRTGHHDRNGHNGGMMERK